MTRLPPESTALNEAMELLARSGLEELSTALATLLNEAMKIERSHFLQAGPYERNEDRRGHANGYKPKSVQTRVGQLDVQVPQVRGLEDGEGFYPTALEKGVRSERALKLAIAEMYVQGVSTRKVLAITRELCGFEVTSSQVSRAAELLDEELESWRTRSLGEVPYVYLDARYEKIRHGGSVVSCAVLIAVGVEADGRRSVLGVSVSLSEAEVHWRDFLNSLLERGLRGVRLVVSDDHSGLGNARSACFPGVPWQRCQFHLQRNAVAYVPRADLRRAVAEDLRGIFGAADRDEAQRRLKLFLKKHRPAAPKLADWAEHNVPQGLTVLEVDLPASHRRRLRTVNVVERLNREVYRRTRVATLFPNEASLLRLVSAVLIETSEEWQAGKKYLTMEQR